MLVGAVFWETAEGALRVGRLAVRPDRRGRGIARALMAAAEAAARGRGLHRLRLSVRLALVENQRLFAALGYREVGAETQPGHDAPTSAVMERRLGRGPLARARRPCEGTRGREGEGACADRC